jgi:hypothetical protein
MRKLLLIAITGSTIASYSQAPYRINSCKIEFAFAAGNFQKGVKTLIFTDSGRVEKEFATTYRDTSGKSDIPKEMIGSRTVYHNLLIHTTDSIFSIDLDLMTGSKKPKPSLDISSLLSGDQMTKVREDTFLNKKCDVIDLGGAKLWYWKGIVLKKELPIDGVHEYATSIDENYTIKEDEFRIPRDVKMQ